MTTIAMIGADIFYVLGDKTRMPLLAASPSAFIRPSPSSGTLGGIALNTSEVRVPHATFFLHHFTGIAPFHS